MNFYSSDKNQLEFYSFALSEQPRLLGQIDRHLSLFNTDQLRFSPDGNFLLARFLWPEAPGRCHNWMELWNLSSGEQQKHWLADNFFPRHSLSPDNYLLAEVKEDNYGVSKPTGTGLIIHFDVSQNQQNSEPMRRELIASPAETHFGQCEFSPDGRWLAVAVHPIAISRRRVQPGFPPIRRWPSRVQNLIYIFDTQTRALHLQLTPPHQEMNSLAWLPDSNTLICSCTTTTWGRRKIASCLAFFDARTGQMSDVINTTPTSYTQLSASKDGLISGAHAYGAEVWDAVTHSRLHHSPISGLFLRLSPSGNFATCFDRDYREVWIWNLKTGMQSARIRHRLFWEDHFYNRWRHIGNNLNQHQQRWHPDGGQLDFAVLSPDDSVLAVASKASSVVLYPLRLT